MGISQILMFLVIIAAGAAYWWFKYGRHGGAQGYMRRQLGLREGEQIRAMWTCYYDIDRTMADKVGEAFGLHTRGINVMLALTDAGRLTIGDNEQKGNPPMGFAPGQIAITKHSDTAEFNTLAGPNGLEKAVVMRLAPTQGGEPFRLQIAQSGFDAVLSWARGSG